MTFARALSLSMNDRCPDAPPREAVSSTIARILEVASFGKENHCSLPVTNYQGEFHLEFNGLVTAPVVKKCAIFCFGRIAVILATVHELDSSLPIGVGLSRYDGANQWEEGCKEAVPAMRQDGRPKTV